MSFMKTFNAKYKSGRVVIFAGEWETIRFNEAEMTIRNQQTGDTKSLPLEGLISYYKAVRAL